MNKRPVSSMYVPKKYEKILGGFEERHRNRNHYLGKSSSYDEVKYKKNKYVIDKLTSPKSNIRIELDHLKSSNHQIFTEKGGQFMSIFLGHLKRHPKGISIAFNVWNILVKEMGLRFDIKTYSSLLTVCEWKKDWRHAISTIEEMDSLNIPKDELIYSSAINSCHYNAIKALIMFRKMIDEEIPRTTAKSYNCAISVLGKGCNFKGVSEVFNQMLKDKVPPTERTYTSLISACEKCRDPNSALFYLEEMKRVGFEMNERAYTSAISALGHKKDWQKAKALFEEFQNANIKFDDESIFYNAIISVMEKSLKWELGLEYFEEMKEKNIVPNEVTYGAVLSCCESGLHYVRCLEYLDEMRENNITINVIHYGAAISCMAKCFNLDIISKLLNKMKEDNIQPNTYIYNTILYAYVRCNKPEEAISFYHIMETSKVKTNYLTYSAVLDATSVVDFNESWKIFDEALRKGYFNDPENDSERSMTIDLHDLSVGAAIVAVLRWLKHTIMAYFKCQSKETYHLKDIIIITGWGKGRGRGDGAEENILKHIRKILRLLNLNLIPDPNKGLLKLCPKTLFDRVQKQGSELNVEVQQYRAFVLKELTEKQMKVQQTQKAIIPGFNLENDLSHSFSQDEHTTLLEPSMSKYNEVKDENITKKVNSDKKTKKALKKKSKVKSDEMLLKLDISHEKETEETFVDSDVKGLKHFLKESNKKKRKRSQEKTPYLSKEERKKKKYEKKEKSKVESSKKKMKKELTMVSELDQQQKKVEIVDNVPWERSSGDRNQTPKEGRKSKNGTITLASKLKSMSKKKIVEKVGQC